MNIKSFMIFIIVLYLSIEIFYRTTNYELLDCKINNHIIDTLKCNQSCNCFEVCKRLMCRKICDTCFYDCYNSYINITCNEIVHKSKQIHTIEDVYSLEYIKKYLDRFYPLDTNISCIVYDNNIMLCNPLDVLLGLILMITSFVLVGVFACTY